MQHHIEMLASIIAVMPSTHAIIITVFWLKCEEDGVLVGAVLIWVACGCSYMVDRTTVSVGTVEDIVAAAEVTVTLAVALEGCGSEVEEGEEEDEAIAGFKVEAGVTDI
jgi:hypothetical protein